MTTTIHAGPELTGDYVLDSTRTRLAWAVRAMLLGKVRGRFDDFEGSVHLDADDPSRSGVRLTIRTHSIQTHNRKRDDHLRSDAILAADDHPTITFASTAVERVTETDFAVTGDLTMHGLTRPVTVHLRLTGTEPDRPDGPHVAFSGRATIDRTQWGITWGRGMAARKVALEFEVAARRP